MPIFAFFIDFYELTCNRADGGHTLYRGIKKWYFKDFLKYGNTKTPENISDDEKNKLRRYGISPSQVLYASPTDSKAWEFVCDQNPSILVLYDGDKLEMIPDEVYLYKLKGGENFKDAVKAYVIIWYK